jgi:hypothetical protein
MTGEKREKERQSIMFSCCDESDVIPFVKNAPEKPPDEG